MERPRPQRASLCSTVRSPTRVETLGPMRPKSRLMWVQEVRQMGEKYDRIYIYKLLHHLFWCPPQPPLPPPFSRDNSWPFPVRWMCHVCTRYIYLFTVYLINREDFDQDICELWYLLPCIFVSQRPIYVFVFPLLPASLKPDELSLPLPRRVGFRRRMGRRWW